MKESNSSNLLFKEGGEMGMRIRNMDWSCSLLGPVESWPQSLKTAVNLMLGTKFPMMIHWGPQLIHFYNDGYAAILQYKHPGALGEPAYPWWKEIWDLLEPIFQQVWAGGTTFFQDQLVTPNRRGFIEEAYFTYSHSPIYGESGRVEGILATAIETTGNVINSRRLTMLGHLAATTAHENDVLAACQAVADSLATNPEDIPFTLIYLVNANGTELQLVSTVGEGLNDQASPASLSLAENTGEQGWPAATVINSGVNQMVEGLEEKFGSLPGGVWPEPSRQAIILPITRAGQSAGELPYGVIIAGVSPRRPWDDSYQSFYNLVAEQAGRAVANAQAVTEERKKIEELKQLSLAKTNFFSNVSHEFRTPLTLMLGPLESLLQQKNIASEEKEALTLINRNAQRLLYLVNNLLNFTQVEAERMQATFRATDLTALTIQLSASFRTAIEAAGLKFVIDGATLPEPVYLDEKLFESILFNLLSNALKFTFAGSISVSLGATDKLAILKVADTGTGIKPEDLAQLFSRFHRVSGALSRTHEGSGIGLALVEELVKLHGGTIQVDSDYGKGTCFTVALPFGQHHLPPEQIKHSLLKDKINQSKEKVDSTYLHWLSPSVLVSEGAPGSSVPLDYDEEMHSKPLILIVDDNGDMLQYLHRILVGSYQVILANHGIAAWELIVTRQPSLIISDVMMPELDGYELVKKVRSNNLFRNVPIILLSALAGDEMQATGLETGADDYIIKPFSARELKARVMINLKLAHLRSQLEFIIDGIDAGFGVINLEGCFTYVNQKLEHIIGKKKEQILGHTESEVLLSVSQAELKLRIAQYSGLQSKEQFEFYSEFSNQWYQVSFTPYLDGVSIIFIDVTERKKTTQGLQSSLQEVGAQNLALVKLNESLDNFVHIVAHDLRSPANNLKALLEIQQEETNLEKKEEIISMVASEVKKLQTTLKGLMTLLRTQNVDELRAQNTHFEDVLQVIITELREIIVEQQAQIRANFEKGETIVYPEAYLISILKNLISNALKYHSPDRRPLIQVATDRQAEGILLTVQDNGVGLDLAKHRAKLFAPFERLNTHTEGSGLGLYLVQSIVEKNNGSIEVDSQLGQGTTFTIYLPDYSTKEL